MADKRPWGINQEGGIFHEGRLVAAIVRVPAADGQGDPPTQAFTFMAVTVTDPAKPNPLSERGAEVFRSATRGTSARISLTAEDWERENNAGR